MLYFTTWQQKKNYFLFKTITYADFIAHMAIDTFIILK